MPSFSFTASSSVPPTPSWEKASSWQPVGPPGFNRTAIEVQKNHDTHDTNKSTIDCPPVYVNYNTIIPVNLPSFFVGWYTWKFPEMEVLPVIIHVIFGFSTINPPVFGGSSLFYGKHWWWIIIITMINLCLILIGMYSSLIDGLRFIMGNMIFSYCCPVPYAPLPWCWNHCQS